MAHEEWRDIRGYEGYYQVSNLGRVRSLDRTITRSGGVQVRLKGKVLVPSNDGVYCNVMLSYKNKPRPVRVHRLVAEAFVENPDNLQCVDHIDCDKLNNHANNLRWCTREQNIGYAVQNGLMDPKHYNDWPEESRRHYRKVRKKAVIRDDGRMYECAADAATDLGVSYSSVSAVLRGRLKTCKGHRFFYAIQQGGEAQPIVRTHGEC